MHFQIKGQPYFLNFVPSEGRWFMYAPSSDGMQKIPVADDEHFHFDKYVVLPESEEEPTVM